MRMELTLGGLSCLKCLNLIVGKIKRIPAVESVSIDTNKKIALVQCNKMNQDEFLGALSDTPYFLREINESENCRCCTQLHFSFH
ncbi:Copper chaperone CopZ [Trichococcus ilyis]|uniref:Copper chaperone CopZ n=1 Tax=Trichococcus ilyis TaxID=640938 RepID=A0A143Z6C0_9LACT|nr:Hypothetical protein TR210_2403 [Trichococcus ilyis]SEJ91166.1 Copper chaperone CopZ [Trichococcus ilyis]